MSEPEKSFAVEIVGGAGPYEAAAIVAVIASLRAEEAAANAEPPRPPRAPAWVRFAQGFHADDPLPVVTPDSRGTRLRY